MKGLSFVLALAAGVAATSASAAIITIGSPLASDCYERADRGDTDRRALEICTRALEGALDSRDRAATLVNRGIVLMRHGEHRAADSDFDAAIALRPGLADAWLNKGFLRLRTGEGAEAIPYLERALTLHARRPALAYFARGIAHEQAGDLRSAYADLTRARDIEPGWNLPAEELERYRVVQR